MDSSLRAWEYRRASDEHADQDPSRQAVPNGEWAERHGVELVGATEDLTSSRKVPNPWDRERFVEAVRCAVGEGCDAVLVEEIDRFTRPTNPETAAEDMIAWKRRLRVEHGLELWVASHSLENQQGVVATILQSIDAHGGSAENEKRSERVAQKAQQKRENGEAWGVYPAMHPREVRFCREHHDPRNQVGYRTLASVVSAARGAYRTGKVSKREAREVGHNTVRAAVQGESPYDDLEAVGERLEGAMDELRERGKRFAERDELERALMSRGILT